MKTTGITHVAHLVELAVQHGLRQVVISPGSRNAPLVIGFDAHPKVEVRLIHDERSAAFVAMGLAEESGRPVAITCTSGSAPANYTPAITEAYYRQIPLLILTADRPTEWVDQGDGQTIRQKGMFRNFIKSELELPNRPDESGVKESDRRINRAFKSLLNAPKGPVHVNIPLSEPLYELSSKPIHPYFKSASSETTELSQNEKALIQDIWTKAERKLIIIGQMPASYLALEQWYPILSDPGVAVLVENTSNLIHFERFCHSIDRTLALITPDKAKDYQPDLLISMGGAIISKRIKSFFRKHQPKWNWRIGHYHFEEDTYQSLTHFFHVHPSQVIKWIGTFDPVKNSNFGSRWKQLDFIADQRMQHYLLSAPFSDLKAFEVLLDTIPDGSNIHMGNSSVVRYCQLFNPIRGMRYYANRGVSGIDGSTSTALGVALASPDRLNVLISGDLSFLYDSNALWNKHWPKNLRVIVINNGGGGIFQIIDGPATTDQLPYFFAETKVDLKALCKAYGLEYALAETEAEIMACCASFYSQNEHAPAILEIKTREIQNAGVLSDFFSSLKANS